MTECTFCSNHATTELNVREKRVNEQVTLWLCDDCTENYDRAVDQFVAGSATEADGDGDD